MGRNDIGEKEMSYYAVTYSRSLSHHGIKGQRWGIRRFQYEDGSLTPEGKKRYGVGERIRGLKENVKNKTLDKYSKRYQDLGMSKEAADEAAQRRLEMAKKVAIAAGVTVGVAAAVYVARDIGRNYSDSIIAAGETIQTLSNDPNRLENGKAFYTAFNDSDKDKYLAMFGADQNGTKLKLQATVGKDIKVAGNKTASKVFGDLMKNDPEFREMFKQKVTLQDLTKSSDPQQVSNMGNIARKMDGIMHPLKSDYEKFNTWNLLYGDAGKGNDGFHDTYSQKMQDKFYEALKAKGYGGVNDVNDRRYSGFNTKATIIFDNDNFKKNLAGTMDVKVSKVSYNEIAEAQAKALPKVQLDQWTKPGTVATGAAVVGLMAMDSHDAEEMAAYQERLKKEKKQQKKGSK